MTSEQNIILDDKLQETDTGVCELFGPNSLQVLPGELQINCEFGIADLAGHGPFGEYVLRKKTVMTPGQFADARRAFREAKYAYEQSRLSIEGKYCPQIQELTMKMQTELSSLGPIPELNDMILRILRPKCDD